MFLTKKELVMRKNFNYENTTILAFSQYLPSININWVSALSFCAKKKGRKKSACANSLAADPHLWRTPTL
jgi:hypothetical protein